MTHQSWVDAAHAATYVVNYLPTPFDNHAPFESMFSKAPDYSFLGVVNVLQIATFLTFFN